MAHLPNRTTRLKAGRGPGTKYHQVTNKRNRSDCGRFLDTLLLPGLSKLGGSSILRASNELYNYAGDKGRLFGGHCGIGFFNGFKAQTVINAVYKAMPEGCHMQHTQKVFKNGYKTNDQSAPHGAPDHLKIFKWCNGDIFTSLLTTCAPQSDESGIL